MHEKTQNVTILGPPHVIIGLVNALYQEMTRPPGVPVEAGLESTVHSHLITFAAEEARLSGRIEDIEEFGRARRGQARGLTTATIGT